MVYINSTELHGNILAPEFSAQYERLYLQGEQGLDGADGEDGDPVRITLFYCISWIVIRRDQRYGEGRSRVFFMVVVVGGGELAEVRPCETGYRPPDPTAIFRPLPSQGKCLRNKVDFTLFCHNVSLRNYMLAHNVLYYIKQPCHSTHIYLSWVFLIG